MPKNKISKDSAKIQSVISKKTDLKLKKEAEKQGRTISNMIAYIVDEYLKKKH